MKFNLKGDTGDLKNFRRKMLRLRDFGTKDFIRVAQDVAAVAVRYAQGRVPVKTGDLKRSIHSKREGNSVFIAAEMDYAGNIEFGTNPHVIRVRKAKSLYNSKTKQFFGKKVNHPGFPPKPYFFNSIRDATKQTESKMNRKFRKYQK